MARGNPALNLSVYDRAEALGAAEQTMTIQGSALKSAMLVAILVATAALSWGSFTSKSPLVVPMVIGGSLGGMVIALVTVFYPRSSPITAPIYAALEGLVLGAISAIFNAAYPGIVINAVALSIGVLALMLFAYGTRLIAATDKFKLAIVSATGAIFLVYLVSFILGLFGVSMPFIHGSGMLGIGFSVVVVIIAAMNLILDFDFIESGVQRQAPAYMEWYAGFGLLVTLVWMYLEILRLLSKLQKK